MAATEKFTPCSSNSRRKVPEEAPLLFTTYFSRRDDAYHNKAARPNGKTSVLAIQHSALPELHAFC